MPSQVGACDQVCELLVSLDVGILALIILLFFRLVLIFSFVALGGQNTPVKADYFKIFLVLVVVVCEVPQKGQSRRSALEFAAQIAEMATGSVLNESVKLVAALGLVMLSPVLLRQKSHAD